MATIWDVLDAVKQQKQGNGDALYKMIKGGFNPSSGATLGAPPPSGPVDSGMTQQNTGMTQQNSGASDATPPPVAGSATMIPQGQQQSQGQGSSGGLSFGDYLTKRHPLGAAFLKMLGGI